MTDPLMLFVFAPIFGLLDFSTVPPTSALASGLFGRTPAGTVFGLVTLSHQVGSALGASGGGLAHSIHGSYGVAFTLGALLCGEPRQREEVTSA